MLKHINQISEQAFLLDFGSEINLNLSKYVLAYGNSILNEAKKNKSLGILNCVPSYNKILIQFDPLSSNKTEIKNLLIFTNKKKFKFSNKKKIFKIPICYDDEFAFDLSDIEKKIKLNKNEIINLHLNREYYVYMIGFMPGLPFMGNIDFKLLTKRKLSPRAYVPAGSVGIVNKHCVIYPNDSPGGWNIIGRTPKKIFDSNSKNPSFLNAGCFVKFIKISKKEYQIQKLKNEKK
tara:strand:- start:155 stop:856 length:702 start_codon:yes stop_codon:yes gene_type:complete